MATHKKLISVELRLQQSKLDVGVLIGVATNVQEALSLVRSYMLANKLDEFSTRITTGSNAGRAANYNRVLQSIKSENGVLLAYHNGDFIYSCRFKLQNILTNKFIIPKPLKANEKLNP